MRSTLFPLYCISTAFAMFTPKPNESKTKKEFLTFAIAKLETPILHPNSLRSIHLLHIDMQSYMLVCTLLLRTLAVAFAHRVHSRDVP